MSRDALLRPHARENERSIERAAAKGAKPRGLGQYLTWFADRWRAEMPTDIHGTGPFIGRPDRDGIRDEQALWARDSSVSDLTGGSHLGSPNLRDPFRRLMENSPFETEHGEYDGHETPDAHYVRPCRAAIARLSHSRPIAARWLSALAASDFSWGGLATRRGWTNEEAELYLEAVLYLLWREFDERPRERAYVA